MCTGEVQHWVWLLRGYMDKCSLENVDVMLGYLVSHKHDPFKASHHSLLYYYYTTGSEHAT